MSFPAVRWTRFPTPFGFEPIPNTNAAVDLTLDALTAAATGEVTAPATLSVTLDELALVATGTGLVGLTGDLTRTLDDLTLAPLATGTVAVAGGLDRLLDELTVVAAAGPGALIGGELVATLDDLTVAPSGVGTVAVAGSLQAPLDPLTALAAGTVDLRGETSVTLDALALTASATGSPAGDVIAAITFAPLTAVGVGVVEAQLVIGGSLTTILGALRVQATGTAPLAGGYNLTTLADLQAAMRQRWDQAVFWTNEEARLAINEALREWNLLTGRWRTRVTLDVTACVPEVSLPGTLTYGMRISTASGWPLIPSSTAELDLGQPGWRGETVATPGAPDRPTVWAPVSLTQIAIWPCYPTTTTGALLSDGVMRTPVLRVPSDVVDLGEEIIDILVDFALHIVAFKEAGDRWRATRPYFEAFLQAAAEENSLLKQHQAYRRWAGLDRRRDLQPSSGAPTELHSVAAQFSRHDQGGEA